MSKRLRYKFKEVLDEVFVDEYSSFDPDFVDSLSDSSEQVSKTCRQDSVKVADSFHNHFHASKSTFDTVVTPQLFFFFFVFHWLLKDCK